MVTAGPQTQLLAAPSPVLSLPAYTGVNLEEVTGGKLWLPTTLCFCERSCILLHLDHGRLEPGWELGMDSWI